MIRVRKGFDLPIEGAPEQKVYHFDRVSKVALIGSDMVGLCPEFVVGVGDTVKTGQKLFGDSVNPGVNYTSPATGEVLAINKNAQDEFLSLVIKVQPDEFVAFKSYRGSSLDDYDAAGVKELLLESGLWTAIRRRPFSKVASPTERAETLFITAIDTHALAPNPEVVIGARKIAFDVGLKLLSKLCDRTVLCVSEASVLQVEADNLKRIEFAGPHPAGLVGTHIHYISPVNGKKFVWHLGYQDVIAFGELVLTGKLHTQRVVSIAGPVARNPRLVSVRQGSCISEMVKEEVFEDSEIRAVSGPLLGGRIAQGAFDYLGRFHNQVSLVKEGRHRRFLGWSGLGLNRFSISRIFLSNFSRRLFDFDTNTNGGHQKFIPLVRFEKVMPLDILPTQFLYALATQNDKQCLALGALELDEEDLSLCTFIDPCKNDFGPMLRKMLQRAEKGEA